MTYRLKDLKTGMQVTTSNRAHMASLVKSGYRVIETSWS